ncbi:unnamed protein product [Prunus armeniaca]
MMFVQYLAKHSQANPSKGKGFPHRQNTRRGDSPSIIKGDLSPSRKRGSDELLGHHMAHKGLMGLPLSPFTSSRIIGLQPALQPSAFDLQPSVFSLQPSAFGISLRPSALGLQPSTFSLCAIGCSPTSSYSSSLSWSNYYPFTFYLQHMKLDNLGSYKVRYEMGWLVYCIVLEIGFHSKPTK